MLRLLPSCLILAGLLFGASMAGAQTGDTPEGLARVLNSADPWKLNDATFPPATADLPFRWVSAAHDAARAPKPTLGLAGLPVAEVIARFAPAVAASTAGRALASLQISIYNRGDAGDLDQKAFDALVGRSKETLAKLTRVTPTDRGPDTASAAPSRGLIYLTPQSRYLLEWSATPENKVQGVAYRAEFIRLRVTPAGEQPKGFLEQLRAQSAPGAARPMTVKAAELPARVAKAPDGALRLPDIPMVDQGQKGYCVTASVERVLRYYGVEVDQNELAQVANTDAAAGTSTSAMVAALRKLASRFRVNVATQINPTYAEFVQEINDYNRVARNAPKASGVKQIDTRGGSNGMISYESAFEQMNGDILLEARTKLNPGPTTRFEREVQARLERGIPLLWSVMLGLLPEENLNLQSPSGHMRLIIGYNPKTHEIEYTDSWGLGHERKTMPAAKAWTITTGLFTLEPI